MDYKTQYQMYLSQASAALEDACAKFLPEESEVCRAARYSLLGGGKRIRAVLVLSVCDMLGGNMQAAEQFAAKREILPIQTGGEMRNLTVDEILYLESDKHTVRIYMLSSSAGPYSCYASLQSFEEKLQPLGFLRVQKSFLVNMRHIRKLQCGEAALESGETLPVSEKNYRQIKRAYLLWKGAQTWST